MPPPRLALPLAVSCIAAAAWCLHRSRRKSEQSASTTKTGSVQVSTAAPEGCSVLAAEAKRKDQLLDDFVTAVSRQFDGIGLFAYGDLALLPKQAFIDEGLLQRHDKCVSSTVTLASARAASSHVKLLFVSHRWDRSGVPECGRHEHFSVIVRFLQAHPDFTHVFVDYSCISQQQVTDKKYTRFLRAAHLRALPLAVLRADAVLLLSKREGRQKVRATDVAGTLSRGWIQLECALALIGRIPVHLHFQIGAAAETFEQIDLSLPGSIARAATAACGLLLRQERLAGPEDDASRAALLLVRERWLAAGSTQCAFSELLQTAEADCAALPAHSGKQDLLTCAAVDAAAAAAATVAALGPTSKPEDRPEVARLLLFAAAAQSTMQQCHAARQIQPAT
jgi:hypothetical protein